MFEDEFGFSFTWAPRGQTKGVGKYRREVSTISGKIYKRHFGRAVRADDLIVGLSPSPATSLHPGLGSVAGPSGETSADDLATQLSLNGCHHTPRISTRRNTVKTASKELDTRANPTWN